MSDNQANKTKRPILVIEDDETQLKLLASLLETENLRPICCQTGQEGVTACRQHVVNVAILDLQLPDMDGLEVLKLLKGHNPHLKVIINTGHPSLESAMTAINQGAFAYVEKVGSVEELLAHIHRAFHMHLADYSQLLEKEVKRRTEELSKANEELKNEIVERERAEAILTRHAQQMQALYETRLEINAQSDLSTLLQTIARRAANLLGTNMGGLFLVQPESQTLELVAGYNQPGDCLGATLHLGEGLAGRIVQTGEVLMIADYHNRTEQVTSLFDGYIGRILGVPLKLRDRITGVLNVFDKNTGDFNENKIRLLKLFAGQAATAIENARLFEAEHEQRELAEALREVGAALSATLEFNIVLDRLLDQIARVVPYDAANVALIEGEHSRIVRLRGYEQFGRQVAREIDSLSFEIKATANLCWMAETGQPLVIPNTEDYPGWVKIKATAHIRSWIGAPIMGQGQIIAFFSLERVEPDFYQFEHAKRLAAFAGQAGIALENARLFEQTQTALAKTEALYHTGRSLIALESLPDVLQTVVNGVAEILSADLVTLITLDMAERRVTDIVDGGPGVNRFTHLDSSEFFDELWSGLAGQVLRQLQPALLPKGMANLSRPLEPEHPWLEHEAGSVIAVPIHYRGKTQGVMLAIHQPDKADFSQEDMELMVAMANQAAIAIENARLFDETRQRAEQLETLRQVSQDLTVLRDLDTLLHQIVERAIQLLGDGVGGIYLYRPKRQLLEWVVSVGEPANRPGITLGRGEGLSGKVWATGEPLIVNNHQHWPDKSSQWSDLSGSVIGAPIQWGDEFLGVLTTWVNPPQRRLTSEDATLLSQFATQAAIAIQNARLFAETQRRLKEQTALREAGAIFSSTLDLEIVLNHITEELGQVLDVTSVYICSFEQETITSTTVLAEYIGPEACALEQKSDLGVAYDLSQYSSGHFEYLQTNQVKISHLDAPNLFELERIHMEQFGAKTTLYIPLQVSGRTIASAELWESRQRRDFSAEEISLGQALAQQAAIAMENARLFAEVEQQAVELSTLLESARAVSSTLDLEEVLRFIARQMVKATNAAGCTLSRWDQEADAVITWIEWRRLDIDTADEPGHVFPLDDYPSTRMVLENRQPLAIRLNDPLADQDEVALMQELETMGLLMLPLVVGDRVIGLAELDDSEQERKFTEVEINLCQTLADQAAVAIENARLHQKTRKQARQVQQILDTVSEGIMLLDSEYRVKLANPAAQTYLNLLAGVQVGEILTQLAGQSLTEILTQTDDSHRYEVALADSSQGVFELSTQLMHVGPETEGWVIMLRDVTEERAAQERGQQQNRLAAVGQLAAGIAHDFNNILTSIIGYAELIRLAPNLSELTKEDLTVIIQQGERAAHLVRQVLDFSRRSLIEKKSIDLTPFLKETIRLLKRTIPEDIRITLKIEPNQSYVFKGDPAQIQQALTNMALNARDAMPDGGRLQFRLYHLELNLGDPPPGPDMPPGDWIALAISDNGAGIRPEHRSHIFEPFFTTKEVGKGTGLGLAQVYGIVKQHKGYIHVDSQIGKGTTFTLYLPALPPSLEELPQLAPVEEILWGQGELILLVEDDATVLKVTKSMLERLNYQVLTAPNGRDALELYDQRQAEIALVLTDVTMPDIGGMALAQTLYKRNPALKVVALTGYPLESKDKDLLDQGIVDWLQKPLNLTQLAQVVNRFLKSGDSA